MALGWPTDPWNNRYLGGNSGGGDRSQVAGAADRRVGGMAIWPYSYDAQQNRQAITGQINTQDGSSRVNTQDASGGGTTPTQPTQPTQPPVNNFFPNAPGSSSAGFRDSLIDSASGQPKAPTAAQVTANPSAYAGTSFDPALGAQFKPPTGYANSTTQDTRDSNGETIKGFQPWKAGPGILDPYAKAPTDRQGNPLDLAANQANADALLRMYPELQGLGWGGSNRRNMGDWLNDQNTTKWLQDTYGIANTPERQAVTAAFRDNPIFNTGETGVTQQNYQQIVAALNAIDPRIAPYWGPRRIY